MVHPSVTQAVAAEHVADLRHEAERERIGRQALSRRRAAARQRPVRAMTAMPPMPVADGQHEQLTEAQELCLTNRS
jgi:hypothetical protein